LFAVVELQSPAAWEAGPWFATLVHETEWLASIDTARVAEAYAAARQRANRARREAERAKRIAAENEIQRDAA